MFSEMMPMSLSRIRVAEMSGMVMSSQVTYFSNPWKKGTGISEDLKSGLGNTRIFESVSMVSILAHCGKEAKLSSPKTRNN